MKFSTTTVNSIAIGGFDGMHKAHQALFNALTPQGCIVVIETGHANLTPALQRQYFTKYPVKILMLDEIRHLGAKGFVELLYTMFPALQKVVVGYDFRFGKDRAHDISHLRTFFKGDVVVIDEIFYENISIHSQVIRGFLKEGNICKANLLLGRDYAIKGVIEKGQGLGKKSFVPTLNVRGIENLLPKEGVYATFTRCNDEVHFSPSVSFIGHRKTTDGSFAVETHLLDVEVEKVDFVEITFVQYLRENQKFDTFEGLKDQIDRDVVAARKHTKIVSL